MKVEWNADEGENPFLSISHGISRIPSLTEEANKKVLKKIGNIIASNVKKQLNRNPDVLANYDGTTPAIHVVDDIKIKVDGKSGFQSVIVKGGKYTGYKWHLIDDGTLSPKGNPHTKATNFTMKAMAASQAEIDALIDQLIEEVANGG